MRTLKDDQFDRHNVEVRQRMELKCTNSPIDFLRPEQIRHLTSKPAKPTLLRDSGTQHNFRVRFVRSSIFIQLRYDPPREIALSTRRIRPGSALTSYWCYQTPRLTLTSQIYLPKGRITCTISQMVLSYFSLIP